MTLTRRGGRGVPPRRRLSGDAAGEEQERCSGGGRAKERVAEEEEMKRDTGGATWGREEGWVRVSGQAYKEEWKLAVCPNLVVAPLVRFALFDFFSSQI
jgi:hypothetical protein